MIRTAILAGILLVMISMAYTRPGALPSFEPAVEVSERSEVEAVQPQRPAPRAEAPRPEAAAAAVAKAREPAKAAAPVLEEPAEIEEPAVAEAAPESVLPASAAPAPARQVLPPVKAEPGKPISLLPETQTAAAPRESAPVAPLVSDNMPAAPAPTLPQQTAKAEPLPAAELPEINVPTRPVMVPQDYASRLTPANVAAAEAATPAAAAPHVTARALTIAPGTKFMTPEERSRELYRLAREMEDTFIKNLTN
ncbi:MAG: hypothetical protein AB7E79_06920 [Rhodospirillaceae bacterium]